VTPLPPEFLDARQLEAFVAVLSTGSMTGAARALGKSQSVITRLIQDLERDVGFALLHRNGPRIAPTGQGVAFLSEAELYLAGLRTIGERARAIGAMAPRPLAVAAVPALAATILPAALADLEAQALPDRVHLRSTTSETVVQAVVARTADLGIASLPFEHPGLEVHWVGEVSCVAVVGAGDALAGRPVVTPRDLSGYRIIAAANPYRLRLAIDEALAAHGVEPAGRIDVESNTTQVSLALARAGLGVAIVEPIMLSGLPADDVAVLPLSFDVPFRWGVVTAIGVPLSAHVAALIAALERHASRLPGFRRADKASAA